jgi:hypothetical protein
VTASSRARGGDLLVGAAYFGLAAWILGGIGGGWSVPGTPQGEAWGRLFVSAQVGRWMRGEAPWGWADLLAAPAGSPFWPVDPLVQAFEAPLALLIGGPAALSVTCVLLVGLCGLGPYRLLRRFGAPASAAAVGGLLVELSPFLLRNLHDLVLEVAGLGVGALALSALLEARERPDRRRLVGVGLGVGALAATSPYYAVYLALGCAIGLPFERRRWAAWARIAAAAGLACGLVLLPLFAAEGGASGRLGPRYQGHGYQLKPPPLVDASTGRPAAPLRPLTAPSPRGGLTDPRERPAGPPSALARALHRAPGGLALLVAALAGLTMPGARRWSLLALTFYFAGPGPELIQRFLEHRGPEAPSLLGRLLQALPLTASMGNGGRLLAAWVLLAAISGGLAAARSPWLRGLLLVVTVAETLLTIPSGRVPRSPFPLSPAALAELEGPTIVFPSGDPPCWSPVVGPKEALAIAGLAGVPVAFDYGREGVPADLEVQVALSRVAGLPIGETALRERTRADAAREAGFVRLVLLGDRLDAPQVAALEAWLGTRAERRSVEDGVQVWAFAPGALSEASP